MARQAIPSTRPRLPSPSGRVAFTCTGPSAAALSLSIMISRTAAIRGASHTSVQLRVHKAQSGLPQKCHAPHRSRSRGLSAPLQRGSVSGKRAPRSPRPAAPSIVSATRVRNYVGIAMALEGTLSLKTDPSEHQDPARASTGLANRCWSKPVPTRNAVIDSSTSQRSLDPRVR